MGCSTFILKRVGQSSLPRPVPQLRHKHTHGRYPNACRGLSRQGANKMSWRHCSTQDRVYQARVRCPKHGQRLAAYLVVVSLAVPSSRQALSVQRAHHVGVPPRMKVHYFS